MVNSLGTSLGSQKPKQHAATVGTRGEACPYLMAPAVGALFLRSDREGEEWRVRRNEQPSQIKAPREQKGEEEVAYRDEAGGRRGRRGGVETLEPGFISVTGEPKP